MYARSVCVVHVYEVSAHHSAAHAYRKRRGGSPCHRRLREVPSGCVPGHGVRVERRARVLAGRRSFVSIHTRSVVARDPRPDLYRGVRDASQLLVLTVRTRTGKGLSPLGPVDFFPQQLHDHVRVMAYIQVRHFSQVKDHSVARP